MKQLLKKLSKVPVKSIIAIKTISDILCVIFCYNLFPYLLNYPPSSINTPFQLTVNPAYYAVYYFSIFGIGIIIDLVTTYKMLKPIKKLQEEHLTTTDILKVRKVCYEFSSKSFLITTCLLPLIVVIGALLITSTNLVLTIKIGMLSVIFLGIPNLLIYIFSNNILKEVLITTFSEEIYINEKIKKTKIWSSLTIQIFSTVAISMIVIFMFVIANITTEFGNYRYETYNEKLSNISEEIKRKNIVLSELNDYLSTTFKDEKWFVRVNNVYSGETEISKFMKNYMDFYARENGGRIYDDFGVDRQGVVNYIDIEEQEIVIGLIYNTVPEYLFMTLLAIIIGFLSVDYLIIFLSSSSLGRELDEINKRLSNIVKNNKIELTLLPVTSTDEVGELTREFNEIQNNTSNLYDEISKNQEVIMLQAKFAAVGELAAGMAHDINNPASSLDTSINLLSKFKVESENEEKYLKLIENMKIANNKILAVVNNTREQFKNNNNMQKAKFNLKELLVKLSKAEENELTKVAGKININIYKDIILYGVESRLYQVLVNLVRNSALSYLERQIKGDVNIVVAEDKNDYIISVEDFAGGIPEEIRETLFKKILTTRGVKGTGLGLYLASGIIEGEFKGKLTFETQTNKGTIFYIKLPKNKEE
ncbi:MAG: HAMP domain-containing sensor histidine kinase [Clostridia bacterium]|nr:HAMP domain-containing sensor histidine kinase [Clostridia bacterium]